MTENAATLISDSENRARRLENFAARRPGQYRFNVISLALLGYLYIFAVLAGILAALAFVVYLGFHKHFSYVSFKLALPLLGLAYLVVKSLFIRIPPPEGTPLSRSGADNLWRDIERLQRQLKAPKVHKVLLTNEFNAAVVQVPLLGFFGFHTNYLLIGVPLLLALPPQHFRAVLAHEFGHLSCEHGRTGAFIYRIRSTWSLLLSVLQERDSWGQVLFSKFVGWYAPFLNSYSYALARSQEFQADQVSAGVTSPTIAAEALTAIELTARRLEKEFWPDIYKQADAGKAMPAPFMLMADALRIPLGEGQIREYLDSALAEQTCGEDTHPSFADRLKGLRKGRALPPALRESAAVYYLGNRLEEIVTSFDEEWRGQIAERWEERREYVQKAREQLEELRAKKAGEPLTREEAWQYATLVEDISGAAAALPYYRKIADNASDLAEAHFAAGRILLGQHEKEEGIAYLEQAMALRHNYVVDGCSLIGSYLQRRGKATDADRYYSRLAGQREIYRQAARERETITGGDELKKHSASREAIVTLKRQISAIEDIDAIYLAEKVVRIYPEEPLYLLGVRFRLPWYRFRSREKEAKLLRKLVNELELPGETVLLNLAAREHRKTQTKLKGISGALLYCRQ